MELPAIGLFTTDTHRSDSRWTIGERANCQPVRPTSLLGAKKITKIKQPSKGFWAANVMTVSLLLDATNKKKTPFRSRLCSKKTVIAGYETRE